MSKSEEKGSRRPDGTYRKVIRVREGYVPPDEIEKYTTPMEREIKKTPARPLIPGLASSTAPTKKTNKKTSKQKSESVTSSTTNVADSSNVKETITSSNVPGSELSNEKKIRNLEKKLREIYILDEMVQKGEKLNADQLVKYDRKDEIESCIASLKEAKL